MGGLRRTLRSFAGPLVVLAVASCAFNLDGFSGGPEDSADASPDAEPTDDGGGSVDAAVADGFLEDVATTVIDACSTTGCFAMPAGFSLVAFGAHASGTACPTGFGAPADTLEGPSTVPGACSCGCTVTANPTCATGMIVSHFDGAGSGLCDSAGGDLANTGCGTDGFLGPFSAGNEHRYTPPPASGGSCSASATEDASKVTYSAHGRVCEATTVPECNGQVCPPSLGGSSFGACIAADGDVGCPAGFPTKHLVGTGASFTCGQSCTCGVTATCGGQLDYFAATDCSGTSTFNTPVDDACHATNASGASFGSHKYVANAPTGVTCTKGGFSSPSPPALSQPTTVCCD